MKYLCIDETGCYQFWDTEHSAVIWAKNHYISTYLETVVYWFDEERCRLLQVARFKD